MAQDESEELVTVLEVIYEEEPDGSRRANHLGNSYSVTKAEAVEGIKDGRYKSELLGLGVIPEGWEQAAPEQAKGGKRKAAEAAEVDGGHLDQ